MALDCDRTYEVTAIAEPPQTSACARVADNPEIILMMVLISELLILWKAEESGTSPGNQETCREKYCI